MIKHCLGCGTVLQSEDKNKPGYILDINKDYCMRCFRLTHYNEKTVTIVHNDIKEIKSIVNNKKGLTFYFVDFLNISKETLKYYYDIEGEKCLVISKSDTIPKSIYLERIREWLRTCFNIHESILFIRKSSRSSVKKILDIMDNSNKRIFYFLGVTNAGKSTFINDLLDTLEESDRHITVSEMPNTTVNFIEIKLSIGTIYDTAGLSYNYLEVPFEDLEMLNLKKEIKPLTYQLMSGEGLIIEPLFRIEAVSKCNITWFASSNLLITRVYGKSERLKDKSITINIDKPSNILIKGVGFFYIKDKTTINIYNIKKDYIEVMPSYMGVCND